jgi:hypothetical protein
MIKLLAAATAVSAIALFAADEARAAQVNVCQPDVTGASSGARTIGGTGSQVPSGTLYNLNSQGCTLVAPGDVGYFRSQGFTLGANCCFSSVTITGAFTGTTAQTLTPLPAGAYIREWIIQNTTTNAVTGGFAIGTTAQGVDVVATTACASTCLTRIADSALAKSVFSSTAQQVLSLSAITSGNSANLTVTMIWGYF